MPITKVAGVITETPVLDKDQFERTGVIRDDQFAICDAVDRTKQFKVNTAPLAPGGTTTLKTGTNSTAVDITLPSTSGTLVTSGEAGVAFSVVQPPLGTSPVANDAFATLNLTTSDGKLEITGNSTTDTLDFALPDVVEGPASSTSLFIAIYDGTTGKLLRSQSIASIDPATGYLNVYGNCDGAAIGPVRVVSNPAINHLGTAFTLDASLQSGGNIYNFLSTGPDAGPGAGRFAIYGSGLGYLYQILPTGQVVIGINNYTALGMQSVYNTIGSTTKGIVVRNAGSQSVNAIESQDSSGNEQFAVDYGGGLRIKGGTNSPVGTATLVGGTVTVSNTRITAATKIMMSVKTAGGTQGHLSTTRSVGTSFTINSTSAADTSTIEWMLVEAV